jgi:alanine dehydrogenase
MEEANLFLEKGNKKNIYNIITIIGVGNVGRAAAERAILLGYKNINLLDNDYDKIKAIEQSNPSIYKAYQMNYDNLKKLLIFSNVVISSIYTNGMKATRIITNELLDLMSHTGAIIMDVAIDQGGTTEQSMATTLCNPLITYKNTSIYCVPNIPSLEPTEASIKLSNAIYPYLHSILYDTIREDNMYYKELQRGLYVRQ